MRKLESALFVSKILPARNHVFFWGHIYVYDVDLYTRASMICCLRLAKFSVLSTFWLSLD